MRDAVRAECLKLFALVEEQIARQATGFFTIVEAAHILANANPGCDVRDLVQRMMAAKVKGRRLPRELGSKLPMPPDADPLAFRSVASPEDIDAWLEIEGAPYRFPKAPIAAPSQAIGGVKHSTKTKRRDPLDPLIELAQTQCRNAKDTAEVWGHLQVLALAEHPPFLGVTPDGLKYIKHGDEAAYFKRDALDKRLHPEKRRKHRTPPPPAA